MVCGVISVVFDAYVFRLR